MNLWKKLASLLLCIALLLSLVSVGTVGATAMAYEGEDPDFEEDIFEDEDDFEDEIPEDEEPKEKDGLPYPVEGGNLYFDPDTGTIIDCDPEVTSALIPAQIDGVAVTAIGDGAFTYCFDLTYVSIPEGVTSIGYGTFDCCYELETVVIPQSVTYIGDYAFLLCFKLSNVTLPENLTRIGDNLFRGCSLLTSVSIPRTVTEIGYDPFQECYGLTEIRVDPENPAFCSDEYGVLYNKDRTTLIRCPGGFVGSYTVPDSVISYGSGGFTGCKGLTSVVVGANVTVADGFGGCVNLETVILEEGLKTVADYAFSGCTALKEIVIPHSVTYIGVGAFSNSGLEQITVGRGVEFIGDDAFDECLNLTGIWVDEDNGAYSSDEWGFLFDKEKTILLRCPCRYTGEYTLPQGVKTVKKFAFSYSALTAVSFPDSLTTIGEYAFADCNGLKSVVIPDTVTEVGSAAFSGCVSLKNVTLPQTMTVITDYLFSDCIGLETVTIPEGVISVGEDVFSYCYNLQTVYFPGSLMSVRSGAFFCCDKLAEVYYPGSETEWSHLQVDSNNEVLYRATVHCGPSDLVAYAVEGGNIYFNPVTGAVCDSDETVTSAYIPSMIGGVPVTAIGNRAFEWRTELERVTVPQGVTVIGHSAFGACEALVDVTLPRGLKTIADHAFTFCPNLIGLDLPQGLVTIGNYAFSSCESLWKVTVPQGVTAIGNSAFLECTYLESVELPESLHSIGNKAFANCVNLQDVTFSEGLLTIGDYAFLECFGLAEIILPTTVTAIGKGAFTYCQSLKKAVLSPNINIIRTELFMYCCELEEVTLYEGIAFIESEAFYGCRDLKSVVIPKTVVEIGDSAFNSCASLTTVEIPEKVVSIGYLAFSDCESLTDIYFYGTEEDWQAIVMDEYDRSCLTPLVRFVSQEPEVVEELKPGHSLNLQSNISINYMVSAETLADYDSYEIECYIGDTLSTPVAEEKDGYVYFTLTDINALQMNETVRAELYAYKDGKTYVSPMDEYSIVTYATNMMNRNVPEQVKRICANLLRYGAASQIYMGYDVENLADAALTEEQKAWLVDTETVEFANCYAVLDDLAEPQVTWYGKTLLLNSTVSLKFAIDASGYAGNPEELELRVTYTDIDGAEKVATAKATPNGSNSKFWLFVIDSLNAPELRAELSCQVYAGDTPVSCTMIYSADSYCNGKTGTLLDLCKALFAYVDEARAYFVG